MNPDKDVSLTQLFQKIKLIIKFADAKTLRDFFGNAKKVGIFWVDKF